MRIIGALLLVLSAALLVGCAQPEERWLTKEEDDALRQSCEPFKAVGGCVIMPAPAYMEMMRRQQRQQRGTGV